MKVNPHNKQQLTNIRDILTGRAVSYSSSHLKHISMKPM